MLLLTIAVTFRNVFVYDDVKQYSSYLLQWTLCLTTVVSAVPSVLIISIVQLSPVCQPCWWSWDVFSSIFPPVCVTVRTMTEKLLIRHCYKLLAVCVVINPRCESSHLTFTLGDISWKLVRFWRKVGILYLPLTARAKSAGSVQICAVLGQFDFIEFSVLWLCLKS